MATISRKEYVGLFGPTTGDRIRLGDTLFVEIERDLRGGYGDEIVFGGGKSMISLFVEGTMNVLKHHGILAGPMGRTSKDSGVFIGNEAFPVLATQGGLVEHLVRLNDKVEAGQKIAIQRNSFGEVVAEYTTSVAGEVAGQRSDAMSEPGNPLAFILFNEATPDGVESYPE